MATRILVDSLRPRLTKMAFHYGRCCGEDADDLLQEAWVGLLEALPEVDVTIGDPVQYLIRRARWRLLDAIKRARVRRCSPLDEENLDDPSTEADEALAEACASDFARRLRAPQRRVLDCLLAGLTWREAGEALGCSSANVAYYVRQIRRQYEEWSGEVPDAELVRQRKRLARRASCSIEALEA